MSELTWQERIAKLEGILLQMDKRLDAIERHLDGIDGRLNWTLGVMITMGVTLLAAILAKP